MTGEGSSGAGGAQIDDSWWASLVGRALHPLEVQIIETLRWIDQPLSAGELFEVFDEKPHWTVFVRHMRRIAKLRAIELAERPLPRNPLETPYRLVVRRESNGC